jgi:hypothetical protein
VRQTALDVQCAITASGVNARPAVRAACERGRFVISLAGRALIREHWQTSIEYAASIAAISARDDIFRAYPVGTHRIMILCHAALRLSSTGRVASMKSASFLSSSESVQSCFIELALWEIIATLPTT